MNPTNIIIPHTAVDNKEDYELLLLPIEELTSMDWKDILAAIKLLQPNFDKNKFTTSSTAFGQQTNYEACMLHTAEEQGWSHHPKHIMVAVGELSGDRKEFAQDLSPKPKLQINLFNGLPMTMPSCINNNLKQAAIERAADAIRNVGKPFMTFQERQYKDDSGFNTIEKIDETIVSGNLRDDIFESHGSSKI